MRGCFTVSFYATEIQIFSLLIWQKEGLLQSNFKYHPSNKYKSQLKLMVEVYQYIKILNVCLSVHNKSGKFGGRD